MIRWIDARAKSTGTYMVAEVTYVWLKKTIVILMISPISGVRQNKFTIKTVV